jgi:C4-dicarboxylate-specific signal transduction histidine kinase
VRADPQALQQVLLNVLNNASEAVNGRRDPKITVEVSRAGGMIRFHVADNGCGIAEDRMKNLFKPFYTTKEHGTGLGLVIVKKMLARMNGTIYIESRKDEGTSVDIELAEGTNAQQ